MKFINKIKNKLFPDEKEILYYENKDKQKENIDLLIDDSHYICNNAQKIGVDTIWYIAKYNDSPEKKPDQENLKIAKTWEELDDLIQQKLKNKIRQSIDITK